ncbi:hypothetical protein DLAC_11035 [Tieghemostelium lacteum]|uniref:Uncharacterized protein n=1 Tax=Tieghemostelium lacteum TaxID=361077 RepID=A0A151Z340_TIELA|nr:hypothetical protein DLAC_11035 [Tieghemostelium lacteum]|eukprot:KYQ88337.1 hypothetical protein DLAC_11035 [Tieghemostelium lacteum]
MGPTFDFTPQTINNNNYDSAYHLMSLKSMSSLQTPINVNVNKLNYNINTITNKNTFEGDLRNLPIPTSNSNYCQFPPVTQVGSPNYQYPTNFDSSNWYFLPIKSNLSCPPLSISNSHITTNTSPDYLNNFSNDSISPPPSPLSLQNELKRKSNLKANTTNYFNYPNPTYSYTQYQSVPTAVSTPQQQGSQQVKRLKSINNYDNPSPSFSQQPHQQQQQHQQQFHLAQVPQLADQYLFSKLNNNSLWVCPPNSSVPSSPDLPLTFITSPYNDDKLCQLSTAAVFSTKSTSPDTLKDTSFGAPLSSKLTKNITKTSDKYEQFTLPLDLLEDWMEAEGNLFKIGYVKSGGKVVGAHADRKTLTLKSNSKVNTRKKNKRILLWTQKYVCSRAGVPKSKKSDSPAAINLKKKAANKRCNCQSKIVVSVYADDLDNIVVKRLSDHSAHMTEEEMNEIKPKQHLNFQKFSERNEDQLLQSPSFLNTPRLLATPLSSPYFNLPLNSNVILQNNNNNHNTNSNPHLNNLTVF